MSSGGLARYVGVRHLLLLTAGFGLFGAACAHPVQGLSPGTAVGAEASSAAVPLVLTGLSESGEAELRVIVKEAQFPKGVRGAYRLFVGNLPAIESRGDVDLKDFRYILRFPIQGLEPGEYENVKLSGGTEDIALGSFVVPTPQRVSSSGEQVPSDVVFRMKLPRNFLGDANSILRVGDQPLRATEIKGEEALFRIRPGTALALDLSARAWGPTGTSLATRLLWSVAVGFGLLWLATLVIGIGLHRGKVLRSRERPSPELTRADSKEANGVNALRRDAGLLYTEGGGAGGVSQQASRVDTHAENATSRFARPPVSPENLRRTEVGSPAATSRVEAADRLARVAHAWWAEGSSDLDRLLAMAQRETLELFEWAQFSDILKTTAPSTVALNFARWRPHASGPVFLGWKESATQPLHLVPTSAAAFASDQGLSALRALFDLTPPPNSKVFRFQSLRRACQLRPVGVHYHLAQRGEITIGAGTPNASDLGGLRFAPDPRESRAGPDRVTSLEPEVLAAIREEVERASSAILHRVDSGFGENQRKAEEIAKAVRALQQQETGRRGVTTLGDPGPLVREMVPEVVAQLLAALRPLLTPGSSRASPHSEESETILSPSRHSEPQPQRRESALPRIARAAEAVPAFGWIRGVLERLVIGETSSPLDYPEALEGLSKLLVREATQPVRVGHYRVSSDSADARVSSDIPEVITIEKVNIGRDTDNRLRFSKSDGTWLPFDAVWQVFVAVSQGAEETSANLIALLFPWSRLEKGAPMVARSLVGASRFGAPTEVVRCVEPAVLEQSAQAGGYVVVRRMTVVPLEEPAGGG